MTRFTLHHGDSREVLKGLPDASVDSVVCDPPYELGFMGKSWDNTGIAYDPVLWGEVFRVLKPGGHCFAFGGTRTFHRLACAIEDAGFELRDAPLRGHTPVREDCPWLGGWLYGSGFPKSMDVSKAIDKAAGAERDVVGFDSSRARPNRVGKVLGEVEYDRSDNGATITAPATDAAKQWQGWGTALKPAWEPIVMARKPLRGTVAANVLAHGTGALNIDTCRIGWPDGIAPEIGTPAWGGPSKKSTAVPAQEGETVDRIPPSPLGRWPANVIHDGSPEVIAAFPDAPGQQADISYIAPSPKTSGIYGPMRREGEPSQDSDNEGAVGFKMKPGARRMDDGSAARFFYCAKASREDRNEGCEHFARKPLNWSSGTQNPGSLQAEGADRTSPNFHPTVKPTDLMRYLCRLVTPKGGTVLDPFMGSGSTGKAAMLEGFNFIGIDLTAEYVEIARARIDFALRQGHQPSLLEATCTPL